MRLFKFYKPDCSPCNTLKKIMATIELPKDIELIELDCHIPENKQKLLELGFTQVPALYFEDGRKLEGVKKRQLMYNFIYNIQIQEEKNNAISN